MTTVSFSKKFYKVKAVRNSVRDYEKSRVAKFKIKEGSDIIRVEITGIDPDVRDIIREEFSNYVLNQNICLL